MKQGDSVLIWGATGGIGGYAVQYVLNGGGRPSAWSRRPSGRAAAGDGLRAVIDRAPSYQFWSDEHTQDESEWRRSARRSAS
jgi:crotonyl-CoA reductase